MSRSRPCNLELTTWLVGFLLLRLMGCASAPPSPRIDNLPMYGQPDIQRPEFLKKADEEFIAKATAGVGSRDKASEILVAEAERYLGERNLDFAMRRYNQAWLLNPKGYKVYWGFGRVLLEQDKFQESVNQFQRAVELINDQFQRPALLSDFGTVYSFWAASLPESDAATRSRLFAMANEKFRESTTLDPTYANAWRRWAMSLYREGDNSQAWTKVREARERNAPPFPAEFLRALENRMVEPK